MPAPRTASTTPTSSTSTIGETEEGELYLVMEYLVGASLSSELAKGMQLSRAVDILEQMCAALARAHRPRRRPPRSQSDNILLSTRGGRKGLRESRSTSPRAPRDGFPALAPKGRGVRTPGMSPEQARGEGAGRHRPPTPSASSSTKCSRASSVPLERSRRCSRCSAAAAEAVRDQARRPSAESEIIVLKLLEKGAAALPGRPPHSTS